MSVVRMVSACAIAALAVTSSSAMMVNCVPRARDSGFAHVDGISMFYQTYGRGDPILMIHGGLSNADVWRTQIAALSAHHQVIIADSRGQGRSTRTLEPITYDLMVEDYIGLLDHLGLDRVSLVGWSDGGIIGLEMAIRYPDRLNRMFIQAANATPDGAMANVRATEEGKQLPEMRHYEDIGQEIEALWANEPNLTPEELGAITVPTAIAIGEHDEAISLEHTEFLAETIQGAKLVLLSGVGHSAPIEDPAGYSKAVLAFIDGPDSASSAAAIIVPAHRG